MGPFIFLSTALFRRAPKGTAGRAPLVGLLGEHFETKIGVDRWFGQILFFSFLGITRLESWFLSVPLSTVGLIWGQSYMYYDDTLLKIKQDETHIADGCSRSRPLKTDTLSRLFDYNPVSDVEEWVGLELR